MAPAPIYRPPAGLRTNLDDFKDYINKKHNLDLKSYDELHRFSVTRLNDFWMAIWSYANSSSLLTCLHAIDDDARIDHFPKFFDGARMNYAENLLCGEDDTAAVIEMNEETQGAPRRYSWRQLKELVARYSRVLRREGVAEGDVVVLVGGNNVRSLAFLLAAASIGAMFASFATDIGEKSLIDRVGQLKPKIMIAELQYRYNGKLNDISERIITCVEALRRKSSCRLIVTNTTNNVPAQSRKLDDLLATESADTLRFAQLPFSHPFVIMFSSGTTGTPKGIVHSQGGLTLNGKKSHLLHNNFGPKDVHFHYSGVGWTLWNISLGAMFCQTTMLLYDGSPFYPSPDAFLRSVFAAGVTGYGGSPRFFSELQKRDVRLPRESLRSMHTLLSTGALLTPGTANWLAEAFGPVCQINFTGGTELCGNFMSGNRSLPSYAGEIAVKDLGMAIDAFGHDGKSVPAGQAGELVCKKPFPNMPVMLLNDPKYERYKRSYFSGFPGVWTHGDLIRVNPETGGTYVLGRSDGVLNPSGVRFGTSELYNILASPGLSEKVIDGLAIGQQRNTSTYSDATERVVLFIKVAEEHSSETVHPRHDLLADIKQAITRDLSRRHVPAFFFEVDEIPHNANGKKMEIQVKQVCNGGREILDKMTLTDLERGLLDKFVRFYDVERVTDNQKTRESKL